MSTIERTRIVLAFAGGSADVALLRAIVSQPATEAVTVSLDLGQGDDLDAVREQAIEAGAVRAHVIDAREDLLVDVLLPALRAGGACEAGVPLVRSMEAVLIARWLVDVSLMESAGGIAHGSRDPGHRQRLAALCAQRRTGAPLPMTQPGSMFRGNGAGATGAHVERNVLARWQRVPDDDPAAEAPAWLYRLTKPLESCPPSRATAAIGLERGVPIAVNGIRMALLEMIESLDLIAGAHGVGRFDGRLSRLDGAGAGRRQRGEAPGVLTLAAAYDAIERALLSPDSYGTKREMGETCRRVLREGGWFSPERHALTARADQAHDRVTGTVRLALFRGGLEVAGVTPGTPADSEHGRDSVAVAAHVPGSTA